MESFLDSHTEAVNAVLGKWGMCVAAVKGGVDNVAAVECSSSNNSSSLWDETLGKMKQSIISDFNAKLSTAGSPDDATTTGDELISWAIENGNFFIETSNIVSPFMYTFDGTFPVHLTEMGNGEVGFDEYYANVLPALMVNQLIPDIQSISGNPVTTHVLCQGNGFNARKKWWDYDDDVLNDDGSSISSSSVSDRDVLAISNTIAESVYGARSFLKIITDLRCGLGEGKSIWRVCVWLRAPRGPRRFFLLVLDINLKGSGCFVVDSYPDKTFHDFICMYFLIYITRQGLLGSQLFRRADYIQDLGGNFMQRLSFIVRNTIYLSMCGMVSGGLPVNGVTYRDDGHLFSKKICEFMTSAVSSNELVWLSPMNYEFMNIRDIYLIKIAHSAAHDLGKLDQFVLKDCNVGFMLGAPMSSLSAELSARYRAVIQVSMKWRSFIDSDMRDAVKYPRTTRVTESFAVRTAEFIRLRDRERDLFKAEQMANPVGWGVKYGNFIYRTKSVGSPCLYAISDGKLELESPVISQDGYFNFNYAHILPALMINQLLPSIEQKLTGGLVKTFVLCQGMKYTEGSKWWYTDADGAKDAGDKAVDAVNAICKSKDFKKIIKLMEKEIVAAGAVMRLCIWMFRHRHAYFIVLEKNESGYSCYHVDNIASSPLRDTTVDAFIRKLNSPEILNGCVKNLDPFIHRISPAHVAITDDMICVSFMARSTVYLSMINQSNLMWMAERFSSASGVHFERVSYLVFERRLFDFIGETHKEGKIVWMSPTDEPFIDISGLSLIKVDPTFPDKREDADYYVYAGSKNGFVQKNSSARVLCPDSCTAMSHYTANPSSVSLRLTSAAPLAHVRECRLVLERLLGR